MVPVINDFRGEYFFLSNFYLTPVCYKGVNFTSSEAAFQSAKTTDPGLIQKFSTMSPSESKKFGRQITLCDDWEQIKDQVMFDVLREKFSSPVLAKRLLNTGDTLLEEGNWWGDTYWGTCSGQGKNMLGILLMKVRDELKWH